MLPRSHCPYCDGWEYQDQPLAIYGAGKHGQKLALELRQWSQDLVLCTNDPAGLSTMEHERMARNNIRICEERIIFMNKETLPRRALFFRGHERQRSDLAEKLGCAFTKKGAVRTTEYEATDVPGLYVVGDASRGVQLVINAAAEGAAAAWAINTALLKEGLAK
jgi:thioredoxin reductase